jgi:galacturonosyltransferase
MKQKTVLILVNHEIVIYNFRKELVERLLEDGHRVIISSPGGEKIDKLVELGSEHDEVFINRHGSNPFEEIKLVSYYKRIMKKYKPDIAFGYTIKPNIYGAIAAKKDNIPFVANITGLGTAVENPGPLQKITIQMYKYSFSKIQTVFFQNKENRQFFIDNSIAVDRHKLLPGSGVNLEHFYLQEYPSTDESIEFVFISRIMKEKGIDQYLEAAKYITQKYPKTTFHVCGFCEEEYEDILKYYHDKGIIIYHGMISDVREILKRTHCTVHPTYYPEGLSNVLLESAASGRPIISTDRSGTRETIDDGINGYLVKQLNSKKLIDKIEVFINQSFNKKKKMGLSGRKKVEKEFNRQIVVDAYLNELANS